MAAGAMTQRLLPACAGSAAGPAAVAAAIVPLGRAACAGPVAAGLAVMLAAAAAAAAGASVHSRACVPAPDVAAALGRVAIRTLVCLCAVCRQPHAGSGELHAVPPLRRRHAGAAAGRVRFVRRRDGCCDVASGLQAVFFDAQFPAVVRADDHHRQRTLECRRLGCGAAGGGRGRWDASGVPWLQRTRMSHCGELHGLRLCMHGLPCTAASPPGLLHASPASLPPPARPASAGRHDVRGCQRRRLLVRRRLTCTRSAACLRICFCRRRCRAPPPLQPAAVADEAEAGAAPSEDDADDPTVQHCRWGRERGWQGSAAWGIGGEESRGEGGPSLLQAPPD